MHECFHYTPFFLLCVMHIRISIVCPFPAPCAFRLLKAHLSFRAIDFYEPTHIIHISLECAFIQYRNTHIHIIFFLPIVMSIQTPTTQANEQRKDDDGAQVARIHLFMSNQCERVSDPSNPSEPIRSRPVSGKNMCNPKRDIFIRGRYVSIPYPAIGPSNFRANAFYSRRITIIALMVIYALFALWLTYPITPHTCNCYIYI